MLTFKSLYFIVKFQKKKKGKKFLVFCDLGSMLHVTQLKRSY